MAHENWLQTLAEVAVALAGFSGLLAGIRLRSERQSRINVTRRVVEVVKIGHLTRCAGP